METFSWFNVSSSLPWLTDDDVFVSFVSLDPDYLLNIDNTML